MEKGKKDKTLATASTLQKVVCPAPERDPQEILSSGWRKVGEQKRYTNRLVGGQVPDIGSFLNSQDSSFTDTPGPAARQNGRQVLDRMFGHLRPHHNLALVAGMRPEENELENGLSSQAARAAYYRPAFNVSPDAHAMEPLLRSSSLVDLTDTGTGYGIGSELGDIDMRSDVGHEDVQAPISPSFLSPSSPLRQRWVGVGGGGGSGGLAVGPPSPLLAPKHHTGSARPSSSGGPGGGGGSTNKLGSLPSLSRSYPQDGAAAFTVPPGGSNSTVPESPRLPAAAAPAAAAGNAARGRRRASVSGEMALPAIGAGARTSMSGTTAHSPAAGHGAAGRNAAGHARRTSLVVAVGPAGAAATQALPPPHAASASAGSGGSSPLGATGGGAGSASGGGGGGSPGMPHLPHRHGAGAGVGGVASGPNGDAAGGAAAAAAAAASGNRIGRSTLPPDLLGSAAAAAPRSTASVALPVARMSHNGGAGDAPMSAPSPLALLVHMAELQSPASGVGGGGVGGGGAAASSPGLPGLNPNVPLSGLDTLVATGLGEAISQLRNIRMGGNMHPGAGVAASVAGSVATAKEPRERKVEPGLAGVTPLQLLPVPLPPIENWQSGVKQVPEVDPCRGIRLVDTPLYVLPRPTAEMDLQVKMAAHQAAMRDLVRAEGAPMSEGEMEAVKLLGRLERSGLRARNYEGVAGEPESVGA